jgi:hypothetical protein
MQGTTQCLVDGTATVCTCKEDLCNAANTPAKKTQVIVFACLLLLAVFL